MVTGLQTVYQSAIQQDWSALHSWLYEVSIYNMLQTRLINFVYINLLLSGYLLRTSSEPFSEEYRVHGSRHLDVLHKINV